MTLDKKISVAKDLEECLSIGNVTDSYEVAKNLHKELKAEKAALTPRVATITSDRLSEIIKVLEDASHDASFIASDEGYLNTDILLCLSELKLRRDLY